MGLAGRLIGLLRDAADTVASNYIYVVFNSRNALDVSKDGLQQLLKVKGRNVATDDQGVVINFEADIRVEAAEM